MKPTAIAKWHEILKAKNPERLQNLLDEYVVFHSPVVHTPQEGKGITSKYLTAAFYVLYNDSFHYVREIIGSSHAALEFTVEIEGIFINGVDLISWNDNDKITDFKVLIRPLKAIQLIHQKMSMQL